MAADCSGLTQTIVNAACPPVCNVCPSDHVTGRLPSGGDRKDGFIRSAKETKSDGAGSRSEDLELELTDTPNALQDRRILLLEDDALISLDTEEALISLGAGRVFVAHTLEEAEALVASEPIDAAVLDLLIGRGKSDALACRLVESRVPVIFASGFGDSAALPEPLGAVPTLDKPYSPQALYTALAGVLSSRCAEIRPSADA
jgi:CheY-like chemotaxis protein